MTYPRRILLAVTGLSPQVVTETLYALGVAAGQGGADALMPTEVHLITTAQGAKIARTALLHPDGGQYHALLRDYPQLGNPVFDEAHIHTIHDAAGQPLADIRSPEENAAATRAVLEGEKGPRRDLVVLNAAAAIMVGGKAGDLAGGVAAAEQAIDSGSAAAVLARLVSFTGQA